MAFGDHYAITLAVLIGFLIGSLYVIWPYQDRTYHETITESELVAYEHPKAQEMRQQPPDKNRPEYERLGEVITENGTKKVEIQTVKQKLIKTRTLRAVCETGRRGYSPFWSGIIGIVIGLLMVGGLDFLRSEKS
ncbi:MAG: hypothetical protein U5K69_26560 [Balneolaceae bacterium]|nr:hypothetical protein [Balneolaceae bacterium]